jgi:serine-type D-Ala-D-Ala carboxypeptidase/endopeptidase (penicillin-binding protein 4)
MQVNKLKLVLFYVLCVLSFKNLAQNQAILNRQLDSISNIPLLKMGKLALSVYNCQSQEMVFTYNAQKLLKPASNMKLLTTASALEILGPNYTFNTTLEYTGYIQNKVLKGNIIINSSGDPSFGSDRYPNNPDYTILLKKWAKDIKSLGINQIQGKVIVNDKIWGPKHVNDTWMWGDIGNYYGTPAYGFNFNENIFKASVSSPSKDSSLCKILNTEPELLGYNFTSNCRSNKAISSDKSLIYSHYSSKEIEIGGFLPAGKSNYTVKGAIPDPALTFANLLEQELNRLGISVAKQPSKTNSAYPITISTHQSPSLKEIAKVVNFFSINIAAEALFNAIGAKYSTQVLDIEKNASKTIKAYWQAKGLDLNAIVQKDGSGLSATNLISPNQLSEFLGKVYQSNSFEHLLYTMPKVGRDGSVRNLGKNTKIADQLWAKSGTMEGCKNYSGYFKNKKGEWMAYSLFSNEYLTESTPITETLEKVLMTMYDSF